MVEPERAPRTYLAEPDRATVGARATSAAGSGAPPTRRGLEAQTSEDHPGAGDHRRRTGDYFEDTPMPSKFVVPFSSATLPEHSIEPPVSPVRLP
jgi:hypothetical protein